MDSLDALVGNDGALNAPKLGVFKARVTAGDLVRPGTVLGTLRVLNREYRVVAPVGAAGVVEKSAREVAVGYGDRLLALGKIEGVDLGAAVHKGGAAATHVDGVPVLAPIAGIFYRRAAPTSPPYVEVGQAVATGQTVGLIEVMKTFNPVVHTGAPGVVAAAPVGDREEVTAGQVLVVVR